MAVCPPGWSKLMGVKSLFKKRSWRGSRVWKTCLQFRSMTPMAGYHYNADAMHLKGRKFVDICLQDILGTKVKIWQERVLQAVFKGFWLHLSVVFLKFPVTVTRWLQLVKIHSARAARNGRALQEIKIINSKKIIR